MPEKTRVNEILPQLPPEQEPVTGSHRTRNILIVFLILAVCAIVGIIILLGAGGLVGVGLAQQNARDTQRTSTTVDFNFKMAQFYTLYGTYPLSIQFKDNKVLILKEQTSDCTTGQQDCLVVDLQGSSRSGESLDINADTLPHSVGSTTSTTTAWCFKWQNDGYSLAVKLESGKISQQGTSQKDCSFQ
jgi:type II secretory pathway pseudopilin PulG